MSAPSARKKKVQEFLHPCLLLECCWQEEVTAAVDDDDDDTVTVDNIEVPYIVFVAIILRGDADVQNYRD